MQSSGGIVQGIRRYIIFTFISLSFLLWVTLARLLGAVAYMANLPDPAVIGSQFPMTTLIGLVIAGGVGLYVYQRSDVQKFSFDVIEELLKVAWPDWHSTQSATIVVIITTIIVATLLGLFDVIWAEFTGIIYAPSR